MTFRWPGQIRHAPQLCRVSSEMRSFSRQCLGRPHRPPLRVRWSARGWRAAGATYPPSSENAGDRRGAVSAAGGAGWRSVSKSVKRPVSRRRVSGAVRRQPGERRAPGPDVKPGKINALACSASGGCRVGCREARTLVRRRPIRSRRRSRGKGDSIAPLRYRETCRQNGVEAVSVEARRWGEAAGPRRSPM